MIYAINIENIHNFGDVMPKLYRLRFKEFRERQSYNVPVYKDMEYDQYDKIPTVYLVALERDGELLGCVRLNPTHRPYMLQDIWPELVEGEIPNSPTIWEGTRFCINRNLPPDTRKRVKHELVLAHQEFGLVNNIDKFIGLMPTAIWQRVFTASGWDAHYLGPETIIDGIRTRAAEGFVSKEILKKIRQKTGVDYPVLQNLYSTEPTFASQAPLWVIWRYDMVT